MQISYYSADLVKRYRSTSMTV